jgi:glycosyltransferase involved in cell wall biosynthesis
MNERAATVSIIIPCYKHAHYLKHAIESALAQTHSLVQVIVVNDGSPDNTPEVAAGFANRICYIPQTNAGLSAARNTGLAHATGEFALFLDADDSLCPDAVERMIDALSRNPDGDVFVSGWWDTDPAGNLIGRQSAPTFCPDPFHALLRENVAPPVAFMIRRRILPQPAFDPKLRSHEDVDLWLRLAAQKAKFVPVDSTGAMYRRGPDSMSTHATRMLETAIDVLKRNASPHVNCAHCRTAIDHALDAIARKWLIANVHRRMSWSDNELIWSQMREVDSAPLRRMARLAWTSARTVAQRGRLGEWRKRVGGRYNIALRTLQAPALSAPASATIVITTKNRKDDLARAARSALAQDAAVEVMVIDDGSTDGTSEMLQREFPQVTLFRSDESRGYIVHRNRAAALARGEILFSIDDDAEFSTSKVVSQTLSEFDHPRVGAVAIPFEDMNTQRIVRGPAPDREQIYITDAFVGTAYAIRKDLFIRLNTFREVLFHQEEERELCLRMLDAGYVTRVGRADVIHHYESPIRNWSRMTIYTARNRILYIWHNVPFPYLLAHLATTTVNLVRYGARTKHLGWALRGIAMGYGAICKELFHRAPVKRRTFELSRRILKSGSPPVVPLREIEAELPELR